MCGEPLSVCFAYVPNWNVFKSPVRDKIKERFRGIATIQKQRTIAMKKNSLLLALSAALLLISCGASSESAKSSATGSSEASASSASSEAKTWAPEDAALMKEHLLGVTLPYFSLYDTTVVFDEHLESILVTTEDVLGEGELAAYADAFKAEGWNVLDVSASEDLTEGAYYYATLPVKTKDGERILEALIYTADEEGAPHNGGTLYVEASDPYVYDFPIAFISDIINGFGSTTLPPVFSADYYEIDATGLAVYCYTDSPTAVSDYAALLKASSWTILEEMVDGYYVAVSPDGRYAIYYRFDPIYGTLDIVLVHAPLLPEALIAADNVFTIWAYLA